MKGEGHLRLMNPSSHTSLWQGELRLGGCSPAETHRLSSPSSVAGTMPPHPFGTAPLLWMHEARNEPFSELVHN